MLNEYTGHAEVVAILAKAAPHSHAGKAEVAAILEKAEAATAAARAVARAAAAAAAGRPQLVRFATPNKDVPVPAVVAEAIYDAADNNDIAALTHLCEQWAGNTQAIDGHTNEVSTHTHSQAHTHVKPSVLTHTCFIHTNTITHTNLCPYRLKHLPIYLTYSSNIKHTPHMYVCVYE